MPFFFMATTGVDVWELTGENFLTLFTFQKDDPIKSDGVRRTVEPARNEETAKIEGP